MLELQAIAAKKAEGDGNFAVALTMREQKRFLRSISDDPGEYYEMLGTVDAEKSECSRAADRECIHADIRESVGFGKLNRMLFGVMEGWMEEQLRMQSAARLKDGFLFEAMELNMTLARVLELQGRSQEASVLLKEVLEICRRVCRGDFPGIGEWYCS